MKSHVFRDSILLNLGKRKRMRFFLIRKGLLYSTLNIKFLGRKFCSLSRGLTDRQAYRQTDTKVYSEDTLSGIHEFSPFNPSSRIGPIIATQLYHKDTLSFFALQFVFFFHIIKMRGTEFIKSHTFITNICFYMYYERRCDANTRNVSRR